MLSEAVFGFLLVFVLFVCGAGYPIWLVFKQVKRIEHLERRIIGFELGLSELTERTEPDSNGGPYRLPAPPQQEESAPGHVPQDVRHPGDSAERFWSPYQKMMVVRRSEPFGEEYSVEKDKYYQSRDEFSWSVWSKSRKLLASDLPLDKLQERFRPAFEIDPLES